MSRPLFRAAARVCLLLGCAAMRTGGQAPAPATPAVRIDLKPFGFRSIIAPIVHRQGYSTSTVNFVDKDHILLTFQAHKLIPRSEETHKDEQDRLMRVLLLHLPDGKIVRETEWRLHDHSQYLWPISGGRFILRVRDSLSVFEPLSGFERVPLVEAPGRIEVLEVSPAGDMMLLETSTAREGDDPTDGEPPSVDAHFYSISNGIAPHLITRGIMPAPHPFNLPFTGSGVLTSQEEQRTHWGFDFHTFADKSTRELAGFVSSCRPTPIFLSDSSFLAIGCRGGNDRRLLAGFDILASANWVFTTDDAPIWIALDSAPESGRFAMRVTALRSGVDPGDHVGPEDVQAQYVRVMNFRTGTEVLRAGLSPIQRSGQMFSLSRDGRALAVLRDDDLEIYALPAPDAKDVAAVTARDKAARSMSMPEGSTEPLPIRLGPDSR